MPRRDTAAPAAVLNDLKKLDCMQLNNIRIKSPLPITCERNNNRAYSGSNRPQAMSSIGLNRIETARKFGE